MSKISGKYTKATLCDALLSGDKIFMQEWLENNSSTVRNKLEFLNDLLIEVGERWVKGNISLTQIYVASKVTEGLFSTDILNQIAPKKTIKINGIVILGTIEDDNHGLGKTLILRFLSPYFQVYDLGVNVPPMNFVSKAIEVKVDIIAVSALMMNAVLKIKQLRKIMDETEWSSKKPKLIVGGAPFSLNPNLYKDVGADAFAFSAFDTVDVFLKRLRNDF